MSPLRSLLLSAIAGLLIGCGSSGSGSADGGVTEGGGGPDGSTTDSGNPPGCPAAAPTGGPCALPSGRTCTYPGIGPCSGNTIATCTNGTWNIQQQGGPPQSPGCPAGIPMEGSSCPFCGAMVSCTYDCSQGGPAMATCSNGIWNVMRMGGGCLADGGPEGGAEGGSDAGGDAAGD
jgi:hypothetical protein